MKAWRRNWFKECSMNELPHTTSYKHALTWTDTHCVLQTCKDVRKNKEEKIREDRNKRKSVMSWEEISNSPPLFLVADWRHYHRLCPSVGPWWDGWKVKKYAHFRCGGCFSACKGVWKGVERPCPLVRNDIVTPRHLFSSLRSQFSFHFSFFYILITWYGRVCYIRGRWCIEKRP